MTMEASEAGIQPRVLSQEDGNHLMQDGLFAARSLAHVRQFILPLTEPLPYLTDDVERIITRVTSMPHLLQYAESRLTDSGGGDATSIVVEDDRLRIGFERAGISLANTKATKPVFMRFGNMIAEIGPGSDHAVNQDPLTGRKLFTGVVAGRVPKHAIEEVYRGQLPIINNAARGRNLRAITDAMARELVGFMHYASSSATEAENRGVITRAEAQQGAYSVEQPGPVLSFLGQNRFMFAGLPYSFFRESTSYTQYASPILADNFVVPKLPELVFENRYGEPCLLTGTTIALLDSEVYPGMYATQYQQGIRPANIEDLAYLAEHVSLVRQGVTVTV